MELKEARSKLYIILFDGDRNVSPQQRIKSFIDVLQMASFADFSKELNSAYVIQSQLISKSYSHFDVADFERLLNEVLESPVFNQ